MSKECEGKGGVYPEDYEEAITGRPGKNAVTEVACHAFDQNAEDRMWEVSNMLVDWHRDD